MKYIKDRFYNSRKRNPSLGAPDQDLFTREERSAFSCGLWVQRYNKFLKPPNIRGSFFFESPSRSGKPLEKFRSCWRRKPPKLLAVHLSRKLCQTPLTSRITELARTPLSFELRMQRYNNFSNPPNIRRSFFSRASLVRLTPITYRSIQIAEIAIIYSVISARTCDLHKRGLQATL